MSPVGRRAEKPAEQGSGAQRASAASDHTLPIRPARLCRSLCSQAASWGAGTGP